MPKPTCRRCGTPLTPVYPGQTEHPLCSPTPTGWIPTAVADSAPQACQEMIPDTTPGGLASAALEAARRGWPVFPLRPGQKRPAFPDHTAARCNRRDPRCVGGHQGWEPRATTDAARIRRGWATTAYNVGIACGPARLVVIDLDVPKPGEETPPAEWAAEGARTGADVLAVLAARAGQPLEALYDTYTVITGRGGRHLYYTAPDGARLGNTARELGWLIDTRARGGYVLAAGSVVDGRPYVIERDRPPAPLPPGCSSALPGPHHRRALRSRSRPAPAATPPT